MVYKSIIVVITQNISYYLLTYHTLYIYFEAHPLYKLFSNYDNLLQDIGDQDLVLLSHHFHYLHSLEDNIPHLHKYNL